MACFLRLVLLHTREGDHCSYRYAAVHAVANCGCLIEHWHQHCGAAVRGWALPKPTGHGVVGHGLYGRSRREASEDYLGFTLPHAHSQPAVNKGRALPAPTGHWLCGVGLDVPWGWRFSQLSDSCSWSAFLWLVCVFLGKSSWTGSSYKLATIVPAVWSPFLQ